MMADPGNRGSAKAHEMMRGDVISSICLAAEPRKPSRPVAVTLHQQAVYMAATGQPPEPKHPCHAGAIQTWFKMLTPTTLVRRLISLFKRLSRFVEWIFGQCSREVSAGPRSCGPSSGRTEA